MQIGKRNEKQKKKKKETMSKEEESVNLISRIERKMRNGTKESRREGVNTLTG